MGTAAVYEADRIRDMLDWSERAVELASTPVKPLVLKAHRQLEAAWTVALEQIDDQAQAILMGSEAA